MDGQGRQWAWWLYGWFSGLMLCGSCFGAVAWGARMQHFVLDFIAYNNSTSTLTKDQRLLMIAQHFSWFAAFVVVYAVEFLCLSAAKLMVLDHGVCDTQGGQHVMAFGCWEAGCNGSCCRGKCGGAGRQRSCCSVFSALCPSISVQHLPRSPSTTPPMATTWPTLQTKRASLPPPPSPCSRFARLRCCCSSLSPLLWLGRPALAASALRSSITTR